MSAFESKVYGVSSSSDSLPSWSEISSYSDDELCALYAKSQRCFSTGSYDINVRRIASDAVMKVGQTCRNEERAISLVRQATTIPVPAVRRAIVSDSRYVAIILEYVPGPTLKEYWSNMSVWQRVRVVWTIRQYVNQLKTVNIPPSIFPGPIDSEPQTCYGCMFTEIGAGPFASYSELTAWFMHKLAVNRRMQKTPREEMAFDDSLPLVLTHLDIHPGNIIIGPSGRPWLIDWEYAGFYPKWFEYSAIVQSWALRGGPSWKQGGRWTRWIAGVIAGFYVKQSKFLESIPWALCNGYMM